MLLSEKLRVEVLAPVARRHVVFTIPLVLRRLFVRKRKLLGILTMCAFETARRCLSERLPEEREGLPGMVAALQTFDSRLARNPHVHCLITDGLRLPGGGFASAGP